MELLLQIGLILLVFAAMAGGIIYLEIKLYFAKEDFRKELRRKYLVSRFQVEIEQRKKCAECVIRGIKLCKI